MRISDCIDLALNDKFISGKRVEESLAVLIENGTNEIAGLLSSENPDELFRDVLTSCGEALSSVKYINMAKKVATIPDQLFLIKFEKYCRGLLNIPIEKREKYVKKVGKECLNKDSVFILDVLSRIEELSKIDRMLKLFEAKIYEKIDDQTYRRLMLMADRTMLSDLEYMEKHINNKDNNSFSISSDSEQGLLSAGWLLYEGQTIGDLNTGTNSEHFYRYSRAAFVYCELMRTSTALVID